MTNLPLCTEPELATDYACGPAVTAPTSVHFPLSVVH